MPRFFFHLHECGERIADQEGIEREFDEIRPIALQNARDIMCAEVKDGQLCLSCSIIVEDENRDEVMRLSFRDALTISGL